MLPAMAIRLNESRLDRVWVGNADEERGGGELVLLSINRSGLLMQRRPPGPLAIIKPENFASTMHSWSFVLRFSSAIILFSFPLTFLLPRVFAVRLRPRIKVHTTRPRPVYGQTSWRNCIKLQQREFTVAASEHNCWLDDNKMESSIHNDQRFTYPANLNSIME